MKLLWGHKDGGPESNVRCWGIEIKGLFSILVLCFGRGSRDAYHSHAFNSISWLLAGSLHEDVHTKWNWVYYRPSFIPIWTPRERTHKVYGMHPQNWVLTFRGPWTRYWKEKRPLEGGREVVLTHGRIEVGPC